MFCKHCGKEIEDNANFCSGCGMAVSESKAKANDKAVLIRNIIIIVVICAISLIAAKWYSNKLLHERLKIHYPLSSGFCCNV